MNNEEKPVLYCSDETFRKLKEFMPELQGRTYEAAIPNAPLNREMRRKQERDIRRALKARRRGRN